MKTAEEYLKGYPDQLIHAIQAAFRQMADVSIKKVINQTTE